ncbi:MAG: ribosome biogenesis GTPase Der [Kiritimatiellia bacterium]
MSEKNIPQRVVAIVGRPNVGKSALFNRIVGRRVAIVHEESGVTRDRLMSEAVCGNEHFELIDTGGVGMMDGSMTGNTIEDGTRRQVDVAIEDAAAVIFVVDITAGVMPLDREVARLLHASGRPTFIAANKADHRELAERGNDFGELGFPVFPVSALHNRGVDELMQSVLPKLPPPTPRSQIKPLRVAIVGRPNAGKSSYINRLLRNDRVIVSDVPGTTRDSIEIPFAVGSGPQSRHYVLVDTAGIRKTSKANTAVEKFSVIRAENSIKDADVVVIVIDATEGPKKLDKKIAALAIEESKGCILLVTKWDLAGEFTQRVYGEALRRNVPFLNFAPVVFASSKTGFNIRNTIETIDYVAAQIDTQMTTGLLNRVIQDAVTRVAPQVVGSRRLKIYYATQVGTRPIRIRLFVNSPDRVKENYKTYLLAALRKAFGLEGAPIVLQFRARQQKTE